MVKHPEIVKTKERESLIHPINPSTKFFNAECKTCGEKFSSQYLLLHHMKQAHADMVGPAPCQYCDQVFPSTYLRTPHMRTVHPGMKTKRLRKLAESGKLVQGKSEVIVTKSKFQHTFAKFSSEEECIDDPSVEQEECNTDQGECITEQEKCFTEQEECISEQEECITEQEECITEQDECFTEQKDQREITSI